MKNKPPKLTGKTAFLTYYQQFFNDEKEFSDWQKALETPTLPILRFNPNDEQLLKELWQQAGLTWKTLSWYNYALIWPKEAPVKTILPGFKGKLFYPMNAASLLPVLALGAGPGDLVLDACAAPGGKAMVIDDFLDRKGHLIANDLSSGRRGTMRQIFADYHKEHIEVWGQKAETLFYKYPNYFDKVLIDAPCSSEKHILNEEKELKKWSENRVKTLAKRQKNLLKAVWQTLKPEGVMVYSTCAVTPEENEEVVSDFLQNNRDAQLQPITLDIGQAGLKNYVHGFDEKLVKRIQPQLDNLDPMFVAKFKKIK
ncbi:MAG: RsmB/NOP family class I SAM-dependent RNA methyltransferase [Patescibacteria group bacterium]